MSLEALSRGLVLEFYGNSKIQDKRSSLGPLSSPKKFTHPFNVRMFLVISLKTVIFE